MKRSPRSRVSRLRMFAGPNGSGKSTIKKLIEKDNKIWLGINVDPDEIEVTIKESGFLDFADFELGVDEATLHRFFERSSLLKKLDWSRGL